MLALILALLATHPAHASDSPSDDEVFQVLCAKEIPAGVSRDDRKLRAEFQRFLRSPALTVRGLERSLKSKSGDVGAAIEELFLYSSTCFAVETHEAKLRASGCHASKKARIDASLAIRLCAPLNAKFKAARAQEDKKDLAPGQVRQAEPAESEASAEDGLAKPAQ